MTTALISAAAVVLAAVISFLTARLTQRSSPYSELADRIVELERSDRDKGRRISFLERDQDILVDDLGRQHDWQQEGSQPPPPAVSKKAIEILMMHRNQRDSLRRYGDSDKSPVEGAPE